MGYTTDFFGQFDLDKPLDDETYDLLIGLNETRRMARNVNPKYGVEGEFYCKGKDTFGSTQDKNVIDYNKPPKTQPGLWCQWKPTEDRLNIEWDGGEKFYYYTEWIQYLMDAILKPRGYTLTGSVSFQGEDHEDRGTITIKNGKARARQALDSEAILSQILQNKEIRPLLIGIDPQLDEQIEELQEEENNA